MKFSTPDKLTAVEEEELLSAMNRSRSSITMIDLLVVCNKSIFRSLSSETLKRSTS
ncbi:hypothetical protein RHMOL_Rhmol07G0002300 [Rhododendron molle]|uniref:Uncharacterized protein n=1 Tax=Rhododendron molle TaxID=49168 RepID=A0ACC0MV67_RHOML|nr:hypothetical protein RHMOL_Rhmol07G0002300 [Rhododendron molle]